MLNSTFHSIRSCSAWCGDTSLIGETPNIHVHIFQQSLPQRREHTLDVVSIELGKGRGKIEGDMPEYIYYSTSECSEGQLPPNVRSKPRMQDEVLLQFLVIVYACVLYLACRTWHTREFFYLKYSAFILLCAPSVEDFLFFSRDTYHLTSWMLPKNFAYEYNGNRTNCNACVISL